MTTVRVTVAVVSAAALLALGAVVALAAPGSVGHAASPKGGAAQAVYCPTGMKKQLLAAAAAYRNQMLRDRAAFFRTHPSGKQRASFVVLQNHQLKQLQQRVGRCR